MHIADDQRFVNAWRERARAEAEAERAWRAARVEEARAAAQTLAERFPTLRRVVLFGSIARGRARVGSDVDLWVDGLAEHDWLDAMQVARALVTRAEVDLVRAEWASQAIAARVAHEGIVLHGK